MKVQLLFQCQEKTERAYGHGVKLTAAYAHDQHPLHAETKQFFQATPSGALEFSTVNVAAAEHLKVGKYYRITIEEEPEVAS